MPFARDLADGLIEVVRERMAERGLSVNRMAIEMGVTQTTLNRQLSGKGDLTIDEWEALALVLQEPLEALLVAGRRRM